MEGTIGVGMPALIQGSGISLSLILSGAIDGVSALVACRDHDPPDPA